MRKKDNAATEALQQLTDLVKQWQRSFRHDRRGKESRISREEMERFRILDGQLAGSMAKLGLSIPNGLATPANSRYQLCGYSQLMARWDWNAWIVKCREWLDRMQGVAAAVEAAGPFEGANYSSRLGNLKALPEGAWMDHIKLAKILHLPPESLRRRLDRWRKNNPEGEGWKSNSDRKRGEPSYIYLIRAIHQLLADAVFDAGRPSA